MKDAKGFAPEEEEFFEINGMCWIYVGYDREYLYQKVVDGMLMPVVISSKTRANTPTFRQWVERETGRPWSDISAGTDKMIKGYETKRGDLG